MCVLLLFHASPKRVKRDGRTTTEQPANNLNSTDRDKKHHPRLQDSGSNKETVSLSKEHGRKSNGYRDGTKNSSDNVEAPRSRSHLQVFLKMIMLGSI